MTKNNSSNQDYTDNSDGWDLSGGTTKRKLTVTGGDMTLTGSGANTYTFPASTDTLVGRASSDTLTNKIITSTTNTVSYATFTNPYKFSVYRNSAATSVNTVGGSLVTFDTKVFDTGTNYDTSTGKFTAPVGGFYQFNALVGNSLATSTNMEIYLYKNGVLAYTGETVVIGTASTDGTLLNLVPPPIQLSATDYVQVYFLGGSGSAIKVGPQYCYFGGFFIGPN